MEPDGIGLYQINGKERLFLFEFHNGNDAKRILQQLIRHGQVMARGLYSVKYQVESVAKVVTLFEQKCCMEKAMDLFMAHPQLRALQRYFLFNHQEKLQQGLDHGWLSPDGTPAIFA